MPFVLQVPTHGVDVGPVQGIVSGTNAELQVLHRQLTELRLRAGDILSRVNTLRQQRTLAKESERASFDAPSVDLQAQYAGMERESSRIVHRMAELDMPAAPPILGEMLVPPRDQIFGRQEFQNLSVGFFPLLLPLSFALARRVWLRSGPQRQAPADLEWRERMQRMEGAIEEYGKAS